MWCQDHFKAFDEKLKLDATRRGRIEDATNRFNNFCHQDAELKVALSESPFLQGSVATNTAIRPIYRDDFDVDVIYPFHLGAFDKQDPAEIVKWFIGRIQQDEFYRKNCEPKDRCIRINYAGDFHVDIIPSTRDVFDHVPWAVPSRDLSDWITNDPAGFNTWMRLRDRNSGMQDGYADGVFVRSVRMMKRWRDQFFGEESAVSSILLATILGKHEASVKTYTPPLENPLYPEYQADAAYLYDIARLTHSCLLDPLRTAFDHPTIQGEDLGRGWDEQYLSLFLSRLQTFIDRLHDGIYAKKEADSITSYRKAFGDTFPA